MLELLKRTTAIAALAALPLSPVAAQAGDTKSDDSQAETGASQAGQDAEGQAASDEVQQLIEEAREGDADLKAAPEKAEEQAQENQELIQEQIPGEAAGDSGDHTEAEAAQREDAQRGVATGQGTMPQESGGQAGTAAGQEPATKPEDTAQRGRSLEDQNRGATGADQTTAGQEGQQGGEQAGASGQLPGEQAGAEADVLIATVGTAEIRRSDVIEAIGQMPPQLQQQPPEMLIPLALDQLVTRELILQEAREQNLDEDDEVRALAPENATETARENAMVQVWLDRELADAATDEKVQETYSTLQSQLGDQAPSLEEMRPQIEQELRQQAFAQISGELQQGADITVFGPDGQPITE